MRSLVLRWKSLFAASLCLLGAAVEGRGVYAWEMRPVASPLARDPNAAALKKPTLQWLTPNPIVYGTALSAAQLDAKANVAGKFVYTPAEGAMPGAGTHTLSVTFTPADAKDYAQATLETSLTVKQAVPVLEWKAPLPVAIGMALSDTQLDAVAKTPGGKVLPGSYLYSPSVGTSFSLAGEQTLRVVFTPENTADYETAEAHVELFVQPFGVVLWGDSLSVGFQGIVDRASYADDLASLIVLPVVDEGVGAQTSTQIAVREGGVATYATLAGGRIPPSGGVQVTFPTGYEPVTNGGPPEGVTGTIDGVHGTVTFSGTSYTFTRTAEGDAVNAPGSPRFFVDRPYASYLPVFWEGRNDVIHESQVLSDLAAQVATVPAGQDYIVLAVPNMNVAEEWKGAWKYSDLVALDDALSSIYGSHFIGIRELLVQRYNPSLVTDVSDHFHDEPPTSLRPIVGEGKLAASIGDTDTTFSVELTSGSLNQYEILTIGDGTNAENVSIASLSGDTVTVVRGFGGNRVAHSAGESVTETDPVHFNAAGYAIVAERVAEYLSKYKVAAARPK